MFVFYYFTERLSSPSRCGTWNHGLVVALTVLGERLDLMILEGFFNLNDSIILLVFPQGAHCCTTGDDLY